MIALINPQTPGVNTTGVQDGVAGWKDAITRFANMFEGKVHAVECLNEWDIGPTNTLDEVVQVAIDASPILRAKGMKCLLGSVGGGTWNADLEAAMDLLRARGARDVLDGICTHPYVRPALGVPPPDETGAWSPPEIHEAVQMAFDIANAPGESPSLPVYVTEYGLPMGRDDDGALQADFVRNSLRVLGRLSEDVLAAACYYSYGDRSNSRSDTVFGLVRDDLTPKLGAVAFAREAGGGTLA